MARLLYKLHPMCVLFGKSYYYNIQQYMAYYRLRTVQTTKQKETGMVSCFLDDKEPLDFD